MSKPRYAIVRVNKDYYLNSCPAGFEEINNGYVCRYKKDNILNQYVPNCKKCNYGDTKEQLIRKVAQIRFRQETQYGSKDMLKAVYNMCYRQAKEIVEFLGVK